LAVKNFILCLIKTWLHSLYALGSVSKLGKGYLHYHPWVLYNYIRTLIKLVFLCFFKNLSLTKMSSWLNNIAVKKLQLKMLDHRFHSETCSLAELEGSKLNRKNCENDLLSINDSAKWFT
jgi:hypothetical protein